MNVVCPSDLDESCWHESKKFVKLAYCVLSGLMLHANMAYAETGQQTAQRNAVSAQSASYELLLQDADALIKSGKAAQAYAMLETFEFEYAGAERFDYLIGIAALDSGRPDKATLAFERVLMVNPNATAARLDMARAYYQLGDMPRARTEFEIVLGLNPSAEAQVLITKYLDAIALQDGGKQTRFIGYLEAAFGSDSNVNNSTSQQQIFVDAIGSKATLDASNVKTSDNYYGLAAGGEVTRKLNSTWGLYAGADVRQRVNSTQKIFDSLGLDVRGGLIFDTQANQLRAGLLGGQFNLGGLHHSDSSGVKGEWRHVFSPSNQLQAFVQQVKNLFVEPAMQQNDYLQQVASAGWLHVLAGGKTTLSASVYGGNEQDISTKTTLYSSSGGRIDGAKNFNGIRIGWQTVISNNTTLFLNAGQQNANYNRINPLFLRQRSDQLYDLLAGSEWRWGKLWTMRAQLNYSKNSSNIAIYEYDRADVTLTIRRDFR